MNTVEKYIELLESDLSEYMDTGNVVAVDVLCRILALCNIKNEQGRRIVIISETDIPIMYNSQERFLKELSNIYLLNGMNSRYERTEEEIPIIIKYSREFLKHLVQCQTIQET